MCPAETDSVRAMPEEERRHRAIYSTRLAAFARDASNTCVVRPDPAILTVVLLWCVASRPVIG